MVNKIIVVGNVGKDPEVRRLESGAAVAKFSLATNEAYKDKEGNKQTVTEWHNIIFWRGYAEVCEKYVKKGDLLYIEGKITYREYTDKETNQKKYFTEIVGSEMKMLGGKKEGGAGGGYFPSEEQTAIQGHGPGRTDGISDDNGVPTSDNPADDLPF